MSKPIEASIVVVDDEPSIRELLVASLHFAGFEVNTAASGSEAIEVIEKIQPASNMANENQTLDPHSQNTTKSKRRAGRSAVPSWDEILFGD